MRSQKAAFGVTLTFGLGLAAVMSTVRADAVSDVQSAQISGDSEVRARAMENFARSMGTVSGESNMSAAEPIFVRGLGDSAVEVRRASAGGLLMLAYVTLRVDRPPISGKPDLVADPQAKPALVKAVFDSDRQVRTSAVESYAATFPLTPDIEDQIIHEIQTNAPPAHQPDEVPALIECLILSRHPSLNAQKFLDGILDDPRYGILLAQSMGADQTALSQASLPKLVLKLEQEKIQQNVRLG